MPLFVSLLLLPSQHLYYVDGVHRGTRPDVSLLLT